MRCAVGRRRSLDPELLWLWCRQAATALIRSLAWEPPYAVGVALEKDKKKKKNSVEKGTQSPSPAHFRLAFSQSGSQCFQQMHRFNTTVQMLALPLSMFLMF